MDFRAIKVFKIKILNVVSFRKLNLTDTLGGRIFHKTSFR